MARQLECPLPRQTNLSMISRTRMERFQQSHSTSMQSRPTSLQLIKCRLSLGCFSSSESSLQAHTVFIEWEARRKSKQRSTDSSCVQSKQSQEVEADTKAYPGSRISTLVLPLHTPPCILFLCPALGRNQHHLFQPSLHHLLPPFIATLADGSASVS